ncbi:peptidyl-alpha-hydroxyglycine alpha-amidating lyase family protein [Zavarzinella formosa]|uniref:peptidyl-alpha-hydroxyglycine alpha-amidating lyase family protein n=1 Tax=Zavarzinella formosa TaxID=360055 RepID=UPI0003179275|nr:peptidyl-alpha-hydroxyglycine alpha-amidating lyase family protein [Zavarzinella formosa]
MNTTFDSHGNCREFGFEADDHWAKRPAGITWTEVAAVAVDSKDRIYVFNRGDHPVLVFDLDGNFLASWGEGLFVRPHGLTIGPDDAIYCTDDLGHVVHKFTPDGRLLLTLGVKGQPSDTGATSVDYRTIRHAGPPFHYPTNLAISPEGDLYITDGYGNARVHKFSSEGRLLFSWGEPGAGSGQFHVPHGIAVDRQGTVFVADRENSRIQLFAPDGRYLSEWTDVVRPSQIFIDLSGDIYVAELGYRAGMWPGTKPPSPDSPGGRVSIFDPNGRLLARWGGGRNPCSPGDFFAPHDICLDSRGDIYVTEVTWSAGGNRGLVPADCHSLQKFVRKQGD